MAKKTGSNLVAYGLIALLVVGLAGFGLSDFGGRVRSVGAVGETEITTARYSRELQRQLVELSQAQNRRLSLAEARDFGVEERALATVFSEAALEEEARRAGLSAGDVAVRDRVLSYGDFRNAEGEFDRDAYERALDYQGQTPRDFEEEQRAQIAAALLTAAVGGAVEMPSTFADTLFDWARETRRASWTTLTADALTEPLPEPTDEDLQAYLDENPDAFEVPETRAVTYAWITPEMASDGIEVSDADLQAAYDARQAEFVVPESRLVERLVYPNAEAAEDAAARLDAGETTFEDLVAERGLELSDIDLGDVTEGRLGAAGEAVFALDEPGVAGPVETDLGPALFRVNAILAGETTSFEDAAPQLRSELAADAARTEIADLFVPVDDLLAGGATLEEVADETELELGQIDWRPGVEDGIAASSAFREAVAAADPEDYPEAQATEDGGIFAFRIDEVRPPEVPPLADIRDAVAEAWRADQTTTRLTALAEEYATAFRDGGTPEGVDLPVRREDGLLRTGQVPDAPAGLVQALFEMDEGEVRVVPGDGTATILSLDGISAPDGETEEAVAAKDALTASISSEVASSALQSFSSAVQMRDGVDVNRAAMNAVASQLP